MLPSLKNIKEEKDVGWNAGAGDDEDGDADHQHSIDHGDTIVQKLDESGELTEVVGSQSMLSQELIDFAPNSQDYLRYTSVGHALVRKASSALDVQQSASTHHVAGAVEPSFVSDVKSVGNNTKRRKIGVGRDAAAAKTESRSDFRPFHGIISAAQSLVEKEADKAGDNCKPVAPTPSAVSSLVCTESICPVKSERENETLKPYSSLLAQKSEDVKLQPDSSKAKGTANQNGGRKRKGKIDAATVKKQNDEALEIAARASDMIRKDDDLFKKVLLSMALTRENPRFQRPEPPAGTTIPDGFLWSHFPPLENFLRDRMREYYDMSTNSRQSKAQQEFNNGLVSLIREEASKRGWQFDPGYSDRQIRDRIRCFFKTHIQNAKKRLLTMIRNPTKRANAKALQEHLALIFSNLEDGGVRVRKTVKDPDDAGVDDQYDDIESTHDAAHQVLALGFCRLSQDSQL